MLYHSVSSQESFDHDDDTSLLLTLRLFGDDHAKIVETETKTAQYVLVLDAPPALVLGVYTTRSLVYKGWLIRDD